MLTTSMRLTAAWATVCALLLCAMPWDMPEARPRSMEDLARISNKLLSTGVSYGAIPSLYRPKYDRIQEANLSSSDDDIVFVVMLPDGPRIYPQRIMVWHQVVNEIVDDLAYAITYCPTTGTLMAYDASMAGLNLILTATAC